ncbi:MAG: EAL domain-containing protein [Thermoleophilia bacterium]|nr:EAL domain-containing protein [Thermoleophilia bacterium]
MEFKLTIGLVLLGTTVLMAAGLGWYAWNNRSLAGSRSFAILISLAALWALGNACELVVADLQTKLLFANLQFIPKAFVPVAWLTMVLDYTGRWHLLTLRRLLPLCAIPLATMVLAWTDRFHHLIRESVWLDGSGPYDVLAWTSGTWFTIHSVYCYALYAISAGLLIAAIIAGTKLHRRQPVALLLGCAIPVTWNALYYTVPALAGAHDYTPATLGIAGAVIAWGLFRVRIFNLAPVARHALVEDMTDGVLVLDEADRVADLNASAQALIGRPASEILSRPLAECWDSWAQIVAPYAAGASQAELQLGESGHRRHYEVKWSPLMRRKDVVGRLVALRDVTDRVLMEENLRHQALTDGLTGLPNRALFMARLDDAIHQARRNPDALFAVMVLDLDRFKLINDSIGHLAGDVLLQSVASKLKRCVREADTVARMGGDEFMILLNHITGPRDLLPVLDRIREELRAPVYFRQQEMTAGSSVGVVIWDASYEDPEDLLRAADTAMYQAKEAGRGCHRIFDEQMHKTVLRTLRAETDLRVGIRQRDFSVSYQPIVDLKTGTVRSLEALLRWHHPQRGIVFPDEFISIAENSGLIVPLGVMALEEVCSQISRWQSPRNPAAGLPVSLNLSPRQLMEPDFVPTIVSHLAEWRIPSDRLILEMTETALVRDPLKSRTVMKELREIGIRLCLDDFGTGWSSLQHLTTFPVQELKIDQTFVSKMARGNTDLEVVRSLTALAHTLDLKVTGEGIEQSEHWRLLEEVGCDHGQGYYIGRPMEHDELLEFLEDVERGTCTLRLPDRPAAEESAAGHRLRNRDRAEPALYGAVTVVGEEG